MPGGHMKEDAVEFLTKPVRSRDLLAAIRAAIAGHLSPRTGRALHQGTAVDDACARLPFGHGDILCQPRRGSQRRKP